MLFFSKLQALEQEKDRLVSELDEVYKLHKDELEFQKLKHLEVSIKLYITY